MLALAAAQHCALAEHPVDAEVVASGRAALEPGQRTLLRAEGTVAVAPLVHPDRAVAVLQGDRPDGPPLDELDRELLWTFAVALGPVPHLATLAAIAREGVAGVTQPLAVRPRRDIG